MARTKKDESERCVERVNVGLTAEQARALDYMRGDMPRAAYLRVLLAQDAEAGNLPGPSVVWTSGEIKDTGTKGEMDDGRGESGGGEPAGGVEETPDERVPASDGAEADEFLP